MFSPREQTVNKRRGKFLQNSGTKNERNSDKNQKKLTADRNEVETASTEANERLDGRKVWRGRGSKNVG
jgi:hypothetical protein